MGSAFYCFISEFGVNKHSKEHGHSTYPHPQKALSHRYLFRAGRYKRRHSNELRSMSDAVILPLTWIFFAIHLAVGVAAIRHWTTLTLMPIVNAAVAAGVLAYWITRWYSYIFQGIKWYVSDQALPLYALLVLAFSVATLAGSFKGTMLHGVILSIDGLVLLAAALFFTFFKMDRLI